MGIQSSDTPDMDENMTQISQALFEASVAFFSILAVFISAVITTRIAVRRLSRTENDVE